jgi:hypothetical protein
MHPFLIAIVLAFIVICFIAIFFTYIGQKPDVIKGEIDQIPFVAPQGGLTQREVEYLTELICPDCGGEEFLTGPQGGLSQNVMCGKCDAKFNLAPFDNGWLGKPFIAERIK